MPRRVTTDGRVSMSGAVGNRVIRGKVTRPWWRRLWLMTIDWLRGQH